MLPHPRTARAPAGSAAAPGMVAIPAAATGFDYDVTAKVDQGSDSQLYWENPQVTAADPGLPSANAYASILPSISPRSQQRILNLIGLNSRPVSSKFMNLSIWAEQVHLALDEAACRRIPDRQAPSDQCGVWRLSSSIGLQASRRV